MTDSKASAFERLPGWLCVCISACMWSTSSFFSRAIDAQPMVVTALRSFSAALWLLPFLRLKKITWDRDLLVLILAYGLTSSTFLIGLNMTSAANAAALHYTEPLWLYLLLCWQTRRTTWRQAVPMGLVALGTIICLLEPQESGSPLGNLLALISGLCFAWLTLTMKRLGPKITAGHISICNLCTLPFLLLLIPGNALDQFAALTLRQWVLGMLFGLIQLGLPFVIYSVGLRTTPPQKASILSLLELVLTPIWAYLLVGELPSVYGFICWVVIILGLLSESLLKPDWNAADARQAK